VLENVLRRKAPSDNLRATQPWASVLFVFGVPVGFTGYVGAGHLIRMGVLLSILLYAFGLVAAVAALGLIRPISWLGLRTRRRALVAWLLAIVIAIGTLAWPTHETRVASAVSRLDQIVPIYQFSEQHETTIEASPERTYRTICAVTVNEIALLRTLTFIRRFGQPRPDSILNPP
jgi:hypothetical protein